MIQTEPPTPTESLSLTEMIDLLMAQASVRHCVPVGHWSSLAAPKPTWIQDLPVCRDDQTVGTATDIPTRGASIIMTASDWSEKKTELEVACRELGSKCKLQVVGAVPSPSPSVRQ